MDEMKTEKLLKFFVFIFYYQCVEIYLKTEREVKKATLTVEMDG